MGILAIKGHSTRGKEVIKILEMLGGHNNSHNFLGGTEYNYYYIGNYNTISCIPKEKIDSSFVTFTLEGFLKEFPYKIGDKVVVKGLSEYPKIIHFMKWFDDNIHYSFDNETWFLPSALNPYKEETIGQFTGLLDKNGVEIYEGDIVKCNGFIYKVCYERKRIASFYIVRNGDMYRRYFGEAMEAEDCEVIGNTYDNPELINGKEE